MNMNANLSGQSFEGLIDNFLKAEHIEQFPAKVFVTSCNIEERDGELRVVYDVQYNNKKYKWSCNKTNLRKLRDDLNLNGPSEAVNREIVFEKVKVFNPSAKKQVDSLQVSDIE